MYNYGMSRMRVFAKIIVRFPFVVDKFRALWVQITLYADSTNLIKYQEMIINNSTSRSNNKVQNLGYQTLLKVLYLLRPKSVGDTNMIRIGPKGEGGYVIYNNINTIDKLISIGVAKDTAFEEDFLRHSNINPKAHLFDHTDRPVRHLPTGIIFHSLGLGRVDDPEKNLLSLETISQNYLEQGEKCLLKVDIDESEYSTFPFVSPETFSRFEQIILELHSISEDKILNGDINSVIKNITENFFVIHIHPNSFEPWINVFGICLPKVVEITFLNKKYTNLICNEISIFPSKLDYPNKLGLEMILGAFLYPNPSP
jgi:hypothetical protein